MMDGRTDRRMDDELLDVWMEGWTDDLTVLQMNGAQGSASSLQHSAHTGALERRFLALV